MLEAVVCRRLAALALLALLAAGCSHATAPEQPTPQTITVHGILRLVGPGPWEPAAWLRRASGRALAPGTRNHPRPSGAHHQRPLVSCSREFVKPCRAPHERAPRGRPL